MNEMSLQKEWKRVMQPNLSVYLDLTRLFAAFVVFLAHAGDFIFPHRRHGVYTLLFGQAGNGVAIFFVLSGFVISFVVSNKEHSWTSYFVARTARIYSVAFLALGITFLADAIGRYYNAGYYDRLGFYKLESWMAATKDLLFVNEVWFNHAVFGADEPYWSLGFEVQYYILFGLLCFLSGWNRVVCSVCWAIICGPKILIYSTLWFLGVLTYKIAAKGRAVPRGLALLGYGVSIVGMFLVWKELSPKAINMFVTGSFRQEIFSVVYFLLIGVLVSINIIAFAVAVGDRVIWPRAVARSIRWFAGGSFTIYLIHEPVLIMLSAVFPAIAERAGYGVLACLGTLAISLLAAEFGERRKIFFARAIGALVRSAKVDV